MISNIVLIYLRSVRPTLKPVSSSLYFDTTITSSQVWKRLQKVIQGNRNHYCAESNSSAYQTS